MDIYNRAIPYDILNTRIFSKSRYNNSNLITMTLGSFKNQIYYNFSIVLRNTILSDETKNKIKEILGTYINSEIDINNNAILFTADVNDYIKGDLEITEIIINIFRILFEYEHINTDTFFAISYNYKDDIYSGYLNNINFII